MKKFPILLTLLAVLGFVLGMSAPLSGSMSQDLSRVEQAEQEEDLDEQVRARLEEIQRLQRLALANAQRVERLNQEVGVLVERMRRRGPRGGTGTTTPPPTQGTAWPDALPFDAPLMPAYKIPTLADCEWTVNNGLFTSTRGLPSASNVHDAYRASMDAAHALPITFGVYGNMGWVVGAGIYNADAPQSVTAKDSTGAWSKSLSFEIVGLSETAEVTLSWTTKFGFVERLGVFNIGLRGEESSHAITANDGIGTAIFDGCWFLTHPNVQMHASGIHTDKWQTLVLRNWKFKGTLLREHLFYLKSCIGDPAKGGGTWIVGNNLLGGNRSGFQLRPEIKGNPVPQGPIVIAYNFAHGYGWDHPDADGGGCLTTWIGPYSTNYVFKNKITNARYSCLVVSGQGTVENYLSPTGFPIQGLHLWGNTFENNGANRACATVSATESVHFWGSDTYEGSVGDLVLDNPWSVGLNGVLNGQVSIHGQGVLDYMLGLDVRTYDPANPGKTKQMPASQLQSYLVE